MLASAVIEFLKGYVCPDESCNTCDTIWLMYPEYAVLFIVLFVLSVGNTAFYAGKFSLQTFESKKYNHCNAIF